MAETPNKTVSKPHQNPTSHNQQQQHSVSLQLPLPSPSFNLEKAVCSHGLFMMAPNQWDPLSKSLLRPLRLPLSSSSALVRVSHTFPHALTIRVYSTRCLCPRDREAVLTQVRRMLRLSEADERRVREFHELHPQAEGWGFGRVFRSPSLFEDMIKCILFCNCQWSRTLNMAQQLCDLQLELQSNLSKPSANATDDKASVKETENFFPPTPAIKESKKKLKMAQVSKFTGENADASSNAHIDSVQMSNGNHLTENLATFVSSNNDGDGHFVNSSKKEITGLQMPYQAPDGVSDTFLDGRVLPSALSMGNFPCPAELAGLNEKYLGKRCSLGYRAGRILKLAQGIVEGSIQLNELEDLCDETSLLNRDKLNEKLKEIHGFGPFTRDNVLMCMGFYNVVPTDTETIRHLKQVHARTTSIKEVKKVVDEIYGKYEPFQFLAYWAEIWKFYEDWFGKLSEMPASDYGLITASNMKTNKRKYIKHKNENPSSN